MSSLYVVATPIGNLEDITLRALRVLREAGLIAAEDTRKTRHLLDRYDIKTPVTSYHEHNKLTKLEYILDCLNEGDVALVCNAGTPGIQDPGYELVQGALQRGIPVIPIPGASVGIAALSVSGLPTDKFVFIGYLPRKSAIRKRQLASLQSEAGTIIALETPHRLGQALKDMLRVLGDRTVVICRELTKLHEEVFRGTISEAIAYFARPLGEFTILIEGAREKSRPGVNADVEGQLYALQRAGVSARDAVGRVAEDTGISKKELYRAWLRQNTGKETESGKILERSR